MTDRTHDELAELLGAYALDALDGEEHDAVDAHVATCPRCRAEVAEHREVAALLAHAGAAAPDGLWDRIAGALDDAPPALQLAPVTALRPREAKPWTRYVTAAVAAAAVLVIAALGVEVYRLDERADKQAVAMAQNGLQQEYLAAKTAPGSREVELASEGEDLAVEVVIDEDGRGYLKSDPLPELPDGRTYQLWGDAGTGELISLAILGGDPNDIFTFTANEDLVGFAITDEKAPGVVTSAQPPVVAGRLA
jgi:hypothetical protein